MMMSFAILTLHTWPAVIRRDGKESREKEGKPVRGRVIIRKKRDDASTVSPDEQEEWAECSESVVKKRLIPLATWQW